MRTAIGVALVIVCLGLTGCSLFGKKQAARKDNPRPFLGSRAPEKPDITSLPRESGGPLPGANGLLAGQVIVEATEQPIKAAILIKNLNREDGKGADLDISTNDSGYFQIPRLNTSESYLLEARAYDSGQLISRKVWTKPPQPAMLIALDKRFTTASTPPPPDMPHLGGKKATAGTDNPQDHKPTVSIDPPQTLPDSGPSGQGGMAAPPPSPAPVPNSGGSPPPNATNIAGGDFRRMNQPAPATIPSPPLPPPQPHWETMPEQHPPAQTAPLAAPGSVRLPSIRPPVPSCVLLGNRLDNFALYDLNGEVWEYKRDRDRRARLVLLDFWRHDCGPCLHCLPELIKLHRDFGPYGLEVIGIACETGSVEEQRAHLRPTLNRYGVSFKTLLSGGPSCEVCRQFQVLYHPLLVLIDAGSNNIIWRSSRDGMDDLAYYALRKKINDRLMTQQSQP